MKRNVIAILLTLILAGTCLGNDYSQETLFNKLRTAGTPDATDTIFNDFVKHTPDLEFAHRIFGMWKANSAESANQCFNEMKADPEFAGRLTYFEGADMESILNRIAFARKVIESDKDAFEAYALMFDTYTQFLFKEPLGEVARQGALPPEDMEKLKDGFSKDNLKMVRIREWKNAGEHLLLAYKYMGYYAVFKNHPDDAYLYFKKGEEVNADWLDFSHLAIQSVRNKKIEEGKQYVIKYVDTWVKRGAIKPERRDDMITSLSVHVLSYGEAYDEAIAMLEAKEDSSTNPGDLYNLASVYARKNVPEKALSYLEKAIENGFTDYKKIKTDPDLTNLHSHKRWEDVVKKAEAAWNAGEKERMDAAVALKIAKNAAEWTLKDPSGKEVKLSDHKGKKVVVLDFWATWCGPCMMAMPKLDEWCKKQKPDDVEVYSINAWERKPDAAKKMFKDRNFSMKLLMDGNDVAKEYGVSGIPYICIIDKEGKIRYEMKGFSEELEQNLTYWVMDLLK